jgi:DNA relaxase NicK
MIIPSAGLSPPASIRGGHFSPNPPHSQISHIASIDWLSLTGPEATTKSALETFSKYFPDPIDQGHGFSCHNRFLLASDSDAKFAFENVNGGSWLAVIPGEACQKLGNETLREYLLELHQTSPGVSASRVDLAIDLQGPCHSVIDDLETSIRERHVVPSNRGLDSRSPVNPDGTQQGRGFYVGSRQSRQYLRVYDKGLQTKSKPAGEWVRWEVQYNAEAAPFVLAQLLQSVEVDKLRTIAAGFFSRVEGPGEAIWDSLAESTTQIPTIQRTRTADGFLENVKRNTAPTIALTAHTLGIDPYEYARSVGLFDLDPHEIKPNSRRTKIARDLVLMYAEACHD